MFDSLVVVGRESHTLWVKTVPCDSDDFQYLKVVLAPDANQLRCEYTVKDLFGYSYNSDDDTQMANLTFRDVDLEKWDLTHFDSESDSEEDPETVGINYLTFRFKKRKDMKHRCDGLSFASRVKQFVDCEMTCTSSEYVANEDPCLPANQELMEQLKGPPKTYSETYQYPTPQEVDKYLEYLYIGDSERMYDTTKECELLDEKPKKCPTCNDVPSWVTNKHCSNCGNFKQWWDTHIAIYGPQRYETSNRRVRYRTGYDENGCRSKQQYRSHNKLGPAPMLVMTTDPHRDVVTSKWSGVVPTRQQKSTSSQTAEHGPLTELLERIRPTPTQRSTTRQRSASCPGKR